MEYFDVCDKAGLPTGEIVERREAHRLGIRHRTAHIWVIRQLEGRTQVLLQQRSPDKDSFPGQWDTSSAGHIQAGDEPVPSALRELAEELGIHAKAEDLKRAGSFEVDLHLTFHGEPFLDNELANVFVYDGPVDKDALTLQTEEVTAVDWFDMYAVREACRAHADWCCVPPAGLDVLIRYVEGA